jgi:hypothetical protein
MRDRKKMAFRYLRPSNYANKTLSNEGATTTIMTSEPNRIPPDEREFSGLGPEQVLWI